MQEAKADRDQELCSRMNTLLSGLVEGKLCWCCFALLQLSLEWQIALAWSGWCAIKASLLRIAVWVARWCTDSPPSPCLCGVPRHVYAVWVQPSSRQGTAWVLWPVNCLGMHCPANT